MSKILLTGLLSLILAFGNGCTGMLWQNTDWDCKPDNNPNLHVFNAARQQDLLVVYNEFSERTKVVRARAYLLYQNQKLVKQLKPPHFVSTNLARNLPPVPLFQTLPTGTNITESLYVVAPTNDVTFTVYSNQIASVSYSLPWYKDHEGQVERDFLSPVTVTVDAVIVVAAIGVVVGVWVLANQCH